jgi:hypothetical protein
MLITPLEPNSGDPREELNEVQFPEIEEFFNVLPIRVGFTGKPLASAEIFRWKIPAGMNFTLPQNLPGSKGSSSVAATGTPAFSIKKNGVEVATYQWAAAASAPTFTNAADDNFVEDDIMTVVAPAIPDATLANGEATLMARLT